MELALIIAIVLVILILGGVVYKLLNTLEKFAKILKADTLQEYMLGEKELESNVEIGQESRYKDISQLSNEELGKVIVNPNQLYDGSIGDNPTTEKFN